MDDERPLDPTTGWVREHLHRYVATDGENGLEWRGVQTLLITTRGRKSGAERVNPLAYRMVGDTYAVFGSKGGAPEHPDWIHNVEANPDVEVEVGTERFDGKAEVLWEGPERDEIYAAQAADWASFGEYEEKTDRMIPVVLIERLK